VTSLKTGIRATITRFAELASRGSIDISDLDI
jgi:hypothetical protein